MSEVPSATRSQQRAQTAEKLAGAARTLIVEKGFEATTVRAIAKRAGLATGTVLAHYGSKEDLFFSVFHDEVERMVQEGLAQAQRKRSLAARLKTFGSSVLQAYAANPQLYGELLRHALLARGEWGKRFEQQVQRAGVAAAGWYRQEHPALSTSELRTAVMSFFSFYYFILIQQLKTDFQSLPEGIENLGDMIDNHVRGLS